MPVGLLKNKNKEESPQFRIGSGVLLMALGVGAFFYIADAESKGESFRIPAILAWAYDLLGKWGIAGVLLLLGALSIVIGVRELKAKASATPVPEVNN